MQKIVILEFGPIDYFEADIQDVMLFIGPQTCGKSTISKAIHFFIRLNKSKSNRIRNI